jgi:two-component system OmpR family sensor kinase
MSLRVRLALYGAAVVALTLLLFGALLYTLLARSVNTNQDDLLRTRAHDAVSALASAPPSQLAPRAPIAPADLKSSTDVFVEVLDPGGSVVYSTAQLDGAPPAVPEGLRAAASIHDGAFGTEGDAAKGTELRLYVLPFAGGYAVAGQSTRVPRSNLSGVLGFLIVSGVPVLLAALLASWLVAGRALRPLREVAGAADDIGRSRDFGRRLTGRRSRDEVALLATSFNRMLDALQGAYRGLAVALDSQRRFVADASHELRTPLATIQANAGLLAHGPQLPEHVRRAAAADIASESERMARLTDRLLTLARADSGLEIEVAPLDLRPLVAEVARRAAAIHPDRTISVDAEEVYVAGDADAIHQLLWILIENAARHARGAVSLSLKVESGWARLVVGDDGPGIKEEERERIFERFYRADASRTGRGAGLGLAIARWIVDQHQGRIIAGTSAAGGAGLFVDLPLIPRP